MSFCVLNEETWSNNFWFPIWIPVGKAAGLAWCIDFRKYTLCLWNNLHRTLFSKVSYWLTDLTKVHITPCFLFDGRKVNLLWKSTDILIIMSYHTSTNKWFVPVQVNLCQKLLFLYQLTQNMTKDCLLIYQFSRWKLQAQNMFTVTGSADFGFIPDNSTT